MTNAEWYRALSRFSKAPNAPATEGNRHRVISYSLTKEEFTELDSAVKKMGTNRARLSADVMRWFLKEFRSK